jgi:hypothetical protein
MFTDGNKTQARNGCAIIYPDQISTFELPISTTVLSNEPTAIKEAMKYTVQTNDT